MSPPPRPLPPPRPGGALWRFLTRIGLLFAWTLVLWGTVLFVSVLVELVQEGLPALARIDPFAHRGLLPWINAGAALLAPVVWVLVATAIVNAGRKPGPR